MEEFKKLKRSKVKKLPIEEIEKYYFEKRKFEFRNNVPIKNIRFKKAIHGTLRQIIKLDRVLSKEKLEVIGDERIKSKSPKVYACTHIGGNDIQRTFEAIKESAYLFLGDPKEIYIDVTGVLLRLNGVIPFETKEKEDRKIAYARAVELLQKGGNVLIYPEGAWNVTDNLPVCRLYKGAVNMARESKADIIPVAVEQFDNQFYVNIGKNIKYDEERFSDVDALNQELRDELASLKWKIWEHHNKTLTKRSDIPDDYSKEFAQTIVDRCPYGFTVEDVYHDYYHDKNIVEPEEAYIVSPKEEFEKRKKLSLR